MPILFYANTQKRDKTKPRPAPCSLTKHLTIKQGTLADWKKLAQFHYRQGWIGAIDSVFTIQIDKSNPPPHAPLIHKTNPLIGVIVLGRPVPNIAMRNLATNNRYTNLPSSKMAMHMLNQEIRCIKRIVIHPAFRGISLAPWLIKQTLPLANTPFVEALAAMGHVNPFFEKAGMTAYPHPPDKHQTRLIAAFENTNIPSTILTDPAKLSQSILSLPNQHQHFIANELKIYFRSITGLNTTHQITPWQQSHTNDNLINNLQLIANRLYCHPIYYLWSRPV